MSEIVRELSEYLEQMYDALKDRVLPIIAHSEAMYERVSLGTGFPVANFNNGTVILTASHVIRGYSNVYVIVRRGDDVDMVRARNMLLLWSYGNNIFDIALLYLPNVQLQPLALGNSLAVRSGEYVFALGYPLGIIRMPTIVNGIVSANDLSLYVQLAGMYSNASAMHGIIQTTLPLNPGFSGGPLFNVKGEVIGIARAILIGAQLVSYATPINFAKPFIKSLITTGEFAVPSLNVYAIEYNPLLRDVYGQGITSCVDRLAVGNKILTLIVQSRNQQIPNCSAVLRIDVENTSIDYPTPAQILQSLYQAYWDDAPLTLTLLTRSGITTVQPQYVMYEVQSG